jgi:hypothetical protein
MKKKFVSFCTGVILLFTINYSSSAQNLKSIVNHDSSSLYAKSYVAIRQKHTPGDSGSLRLNERNAAAVRSFIKDFPNVAGARWIETDNRLFVANFVHDNVQNCVVYNNKGSRESVIRYYFEEKLSRNVRHVVKSAYYDFDIYCVNEITANNLTVYTITLTDQTRETTFWKIVQVVDGEMEVIREYEQKAD